jgi:hypothetical protein
MDSLDIEKILSFMNMQMLAAIALVLTAWVQFTKVYFPEKFVKLWTLASGIGLSYLIFCCAGIKGNAIAIILHGIVATVLSSLGYELLKGTKLGLRGTDELKKK